MNFRIWLIIAIAISIASCADTVRIANPSLSSPHDLPISISRSAQNAAASGYDKISFDMDLSRINSEEIVASNIRYIIRSCVENSGTLTGEILIDGVTWRDLLNRRRVLNSDFIRAELYVPRDLKIAKILNGKPIAVQTLLDRRVCLSLEGYTRSGARISSNKLEIERAGA